MLLIGCRVGKFVKGKVELDPERTVGELLRESGGEASPPVTLKIRLGAVSCLLDNRLIK